MAISILIVEDKEVWANKLRTMYEDILGTDCLVRIADTYGKAEDMLKDRKQDWDLLSLDINLEDANGLDLLEMARQTNWVKGAIVISGIEFDMGHIPIPSEEVAQLRVKLPTEVQEIFPGAMLLSKNPLSYSPDVDSVNDPEVIDKIIEAFKKDLTADILRELASPSYKLDVSEAEYDVVEPRVSIALKSSPKKTTLITGKYARLLYLLARKKKTREDYGRVSKYELLSIFFHTTTAQSTIDSVKRHLHTKGIDPSFVIEGSPKIGYSLVDTVECSGVDRKFEPNYTLVVNQGYGPNDISVTIKFNREGREDKRNFSDSDAMFLWDLAVLRESLESISATRVLERFEPNFDAVDKKAILETAREKVSEFKDRLRENEKPLDPYRIITSNNANTGWRLNKDVEVVGLKEVFKHLGLDETKLGLDHIKKQSPDREVEDGENERKVRDFEKKHIEFLKENKQYFTPWEVKLAMAIESGVSAKDIAEEQGLETDEIEAAIIALKKKWRDLGGPDLT